MRRGSLVRIVTLLGITLATAQGASANIFENVTSKDRFVTLIEGKALTRMGIKLDVSRQGDIRGRAFGRDVTGRWNWQDGYFCRTLFWGQMDLGDNCQAVDIQGNTIRFTSDQGSGRSADLTLR
jgi:hypothetical protein